MNNKGVLNTRPSLGRKTQMRSVWIAAAILPSFMGSVAAQTTCDILAETMQQDVLIQGSVGVQFAEHQRAICKVENRDFGTAKRKSLDGSFFMPRYVDAILKTSSNEQSWGNHYDSFCSLDEGTVATNHQASLDVRRTSEAAYAAIVDCAKHYADQNGIFGTLDVTERRDGFSISVRHRTNANSEWAVTGVNPAPRSALLECNEDLHKATRDNPKLIREATYTISCSKDPEASIRVAVNTTSGTLPSFNIESFGEKLSEMESRIAALESRNVSPTIPQSLSVTSIEAQELRIVDERGRDRMKISVVKSQDAGNLFDQVFLEMLHSSGKSLARLYPTTNGGAELELGSLDGKRWMTATTNREWGHVPAIMRRPDNTVLMSSPP